MSGDEGREPGGGDRAMNERELDELLGAYALDAVDDDERRAVEEYLLINPRARAEVEEHREVASLLAWSGPAAPEGLWDRIAENLDDTAPAPSRELAAVLALDGTREPRPRGAALRRRARWLIAGSWVATAAAAALVAVLVVNAGDDDPERQDAATAPLELVVERARAAESSKVVELVSEDGRP